MNKITVILQILLLTLFVSCYDALDTYENGKSYNLRDRGPAGGWIFFINPNYRTDGWRYLEAAPEDQSSSSNWGPGSESLPTQIEIGNGKKNSEWIKINRVLSNYNAFKVCNDYRGGGYSDWFLPSRDELNRMYINLKKGTDENNSVYTPVGNLSTAEYWSSSQSSNSWSYTRYFSTGTETLEVQNGTYIYVRAIRAF